MTSSALPKDKNPSESSVRSALEEALREGVRKMLLEAIEHEVLEYVQRSQKMKDEDNRNLVTRNGFLPARDIQTGLGSIWMKIVRAFF